MKWIAMPVHGTDLSLHPLPIFKANEDEFYRQLHAIADDAQPAIRREFQTAIERLRNEARLDDLKTAINQNDFNAILAALGMQAFAAQMGSMIRRLHQIFTDSALATQTTLPAEAQFALRFDLVNPQTVAFLRDYDFNLIRELDDTTREGLRQILLDSQERGLTVDQTAKRLQAFIGLTQRQSISIDNYQAMLAEEGVAANVIERRVNAFRDRLIRMRSQVIAETETINAANAGQQALWEQAMAEGYLDFSQRKFWIVTRDDRTCDICNAIPGMNPEGVGVGESFATPVGPKRGPTAHPRCRCAMALA